MISRINKIKDFGGGKNFENNGEVPEFKKFNLIYGWNYSGKTMLSRVFRCLEKSEKHRDYADAKFELEISGKKYDNNFSSPKPNIRVFNSDFMKENLKWDIDDIIEPIILMLGEENIKLQTELRKKEETLIKIREENGRNKKDIDKAATYKAKEIKSILSLSNFDKKYLEKIIEKVKNDTSGYILKTDFDKYKTRALSTEQKPIIENITFNIKDLEILREKSEEKLYRQISSNKIEELLKDPQINSWVETGKNLHEVKQFVNFAETRCQ
ncbi:hypothetical protein AGMMS49953_00210 [Endomicrobiia bacterium]|nr:hypothetical protein AGMMS49953_00210 [Endomicrobiia bacterium]